MKQCNTYLTSTNTVYQVITCIDNLFRTLLGVILGPSSQEDPRHCQVQAVPKSV